MIFLLVFAIDFYSLELKFNVINAHAYYFFLRSNSSCIQTKTKQSRFIEARNLYGCRVRYTFKANECINNLVLLFRTRPICFNKRLTQGKLIQAETAGILLFTTYCCGDPKRFQHFRKFIRNLYGYYYVA